MNRRDFLKKLGLTVPAVVIGTKAWKEDEPEVEEPIPEDNGEYERPQLQYWPSSSTQMIPQHMISASFMGIHDGWGVPK